MGESTDAADRFDSRMRRIALWSVVFSVAIVVSPWLLRTTRAQHLRDAAIALNQRDFRETRRIADLVLSDSPDDQQAALFGGYAAAGNYQHEQSIDYLARLANDGSGSYESVMASFITGQRWVKLGNLKEAENHFSYVIRHWPSHPMVNREFAYLMQVQGRCWESVAPMLRRIRQGIFGPSEFHIVGSPENRFINDSQLINLARAQYPEDVNGMLPEARLAMLTNNPRRAEELLVGIIQRRPSFVQPYVDFGRLLIDENRQSEFLQLDEELPDSADEHPGIWMNRGLCAEATGDLKAAIGCLIQAVQIAPNHVEANYALSQFLSRDGHKEFAQHFGERARILAEIELAMPEFHDDPTIEQSKTLSHQFESLSRHLEAAAIAQFAINMASGQPEWAVEAIRRNARALMKQPNGLFPRSASDEFRAIVSTYPTDLSGRSRHVAPAVNSKPIPLIPAARFENTAVASGLDFAYFNGSRTIRGMEHIFETTGGGIVAVDVDQDSQPDLYLTQGAPLWQDDSSRPVDQETPEDKLFANRNGQFRDVTIASGLGDRLFSQGATTGDINNDGFPDIYLCNLGSNAFYLNNGDGTFSEITLQTSTAGDVWSLSAAIADLNSDSLPDLYVVNYLKKESVFDRLCKKNGEPLTCAPTMFPAEQDRLFINLGDGSFADQTQQCGIVRPDGKGLAILVADFDQAGGLEIFVGNDTTPNFYFVDTLQSGHVLAYEDQAITSGLAVDGTGRSQATMGTAFADIDGNGLPDLFLTNFYKDANTFYLQPARHSFIDMTRSANLYESSIETLGFGTEFIDGNLDGFPDLFVTNGHVDRTYATGDPDEMSPQLYMNQQNGQLQLCDSGEVGEYFNGKYLGRSVCRIDFNQDLRDDLAVLHLYSPVALLENLATDSISGHSIRLDLRSVREARDAIGAVLEVVSAGHRQSIQLTAGDGYMTSNDRGITVGV
ncbi:MAG: VCBS repeat-containing protein, partial [Planctomycetaceae bacterium]|nr:VCBS repeat-containing protein [Planctomycetaceae bacterium]